MAQINVYLGFNGKCREAMNFYKDCLGGELFLQVVSESPMAAQCPAGMQDQVLHSSLTKGDLLLMATDMVGPDGYQKGNNVALSISCTSEEETNTFFNNLSAGGYVIDPLKDQFWGATFGCLVDKFGNTWMLNYQK